MYNYYYVSIYTTPYIILLLYLLIFLCKTITTVTEDTTYKYNSVRDMRVKVKIVSSLGRILVSYFFGFLTECEWYLLHYFSFFALLSSR